VKKLGAYKKILWIVNKISRFATGILAVRITSYRTVLPEEIQYEPRIVCTVQGLLYMYVCRPIAAVRIVSYCTVRGLPYVLYRSRFVSCRIVPTLSSAHVVLFRSYQDSILAVRVWIVSSYHDFSRAVLYETYGTICGWNDTILGAWSVPIRIVMLWSDTYLWNWLYTNCILQAVSIGPNSV
jgi:hypothetical protein